MNNLFLISNAGKNILIILAVLVFFGAIVFGIIMLKRHTKLFNKDEKKPDDKEIVKEELNRVLEEVEDEETIKAMENYSKNENNINNNQTQNEQKTSTTEEINK